MALTIEVDLPVRPDGPRLARLRLNRLHGKVGPEVLDNIRLMVSELVTNSIRHAGLPRDSSIRLTVQVDGSRIRVEVRDPGPGFHVRPVAPSMYQTSGWGLYLVDQLSDRWGVVKEDATSVWFEVDGAHPRERLASA